MSVPDRVVRIELISFFNLYPETIASSEEMAERLNRDRCQVERQMEDLVELRILEKSVDDDGALYSYLAPMCLNLISRKGWNKAAADALAGSLVRIKGKDDGPEEREKQEEAEGAEGGEDGETAIRMRLMIDTLRRERWRDCLELLLDTLYQAQKTPCAAYHLGDGCSEMLWECQRGAGDIMVGMTRVENVQNMVVEGELIRENGFLETMHYLKYLYPLNRDEHVLICICRKGSFKADLHLLKSLIIDTMPVVAEKRRLRVAEEITAEKVLQDSIYWNALHISDIRRDLIGALASVAKSVDAERVSLLLEDGNGSLRTLTTYGTRRYEENRSRPFPIGEGVAGWCAKNGDIANLDDPRIDSRYVENEYDDIDSLLCCPLMPPDGEVMGAICAVNKHGMKSSLGARFNTGDVRLVEGIAKTLVNAFISRDNGTRVLPRKMINEAMGASTA